MRGLICALPFTLISFGLFTYFSMLRSANVPGIQAKEAYLYLTVSVVFCVGSKLYHKFWLRVQEHYDETWMTAGSSVATARTTGAISSRTPWTRRGRRIPRVEGVRGEDHRGDRHAHLHQLGLRRRGRNLHGTGHYSRQACVGDVRRGRVREHGRGCGHVRLQIVLGRERLPREGSVRLPRLRSHRRRPGRVRSSQEQLQELLQGPQDGEERGQRGLLGADLHIPDHLADHPPKLIDLANPKTAGQAKDMAVQLLFPFSFVSTYANIFFHAIYTVWDEPCYGVNCLNVMRPAMYMVVLPAIAVQVASMLVPCAKYRYALLSEVKALKKALGKGEGDTIDRSFIEVQNKRPDFTSVEINNDMNVMFILLGYMLLFGWAAPGITLFILITFLLKLRIDAFKLCSVHQRIVPGADSTGIGGWNDVLQTIIVMGRWTAFIIPVVNLEYNAGAEESTLTWLFQGVTHTNHGLTTVQKVVFIFLCKELVDRICGLVDVFIPDVRQVTKLMAAKREKMRVKLSSKIARAEDDAHVTDPSKQKLKDYIQTLVQATEETITGVQNRSLLTLDANNPKWSDYEHSDFAPADKTKTYFGESASVA